MKWVLIIYAFMLGLIWAYIFKYIINEMSKKKDMELGPLIFLLATGEFLITFLILLIYLNEMARTMIMGFLIGAVICVLRGGIIEERTN